MYWERKIHEVLKFEKKNSKDFFNSSNKPPQYTPHKIVSQSKVRKAIEKMALGKPKKTLNVHYIFCSEIQKNYSFCFSLINCR